ncbi:MAG: ABC transporter permease [Anaerolineae bacterium]|jgi:NitT/TauT family transport system permease protein|nr:ABC transporter permease [Anaerolineae bacterium]
MTASIPRKKRVDFSPRRQSSGIVWLPFTLALGIFVWYLVVWLGDLEAFILPTPYLVWTRFVRAVSDGSLLRHTLVTAGEVFAGLALGALSASLLGYILAKSHAVERFVAPYIVASQSVPTVAIAPLLVIWFGPGIASKVLICALIVFFPILINTIVGIRSVPEDLRDLMRSLHASRWQSFKLLEVPAALPVLLGGLRIGATLSVIGAVVGEFVGADRGLGFMINDARGRYDTALVFVAVVTLVALAMALYGLVVLLEARFLAWEKRPDRYNGKS